VVPQWTKDRDRDGGVRIKGRRLRNKMRGTKMRSGVDKDEERRDVDSEERWEEERDGIRQDMGQVGGQDKM